jgi:amidohydrolase
VRRTVNKEDLLREAKALGPHLTELREEFHRHPELSGEEEKTADRIARELRSIGGYRIREHVAGYGIIADLDAGFSGRDGDHRACRVLLRADMDALPVEEKTGLPFASQEPGKMHACGHDMHMAFVLGAARLLAAHQRELKNSVRLVFQPREELAPSGGSRDMIAAGCLKDVDAAFGLHVWPSLTAGVIGCREGAQMAVSDRFAVDIAGETSHGASPDQGRDAVLAGSLFVAAAQQIVSRNAEPQDALVVSIGIFNAGERYNVVASGAHLEGTVRSLSDETAAMAERRLKDILEGICAACGCTGTLAVQKGYSATSNTGDMARYVLSEAAELLGEERAARVPRSGMAAEDFGFYLKEVPGAFFWIGTAEPGEPVYPLHSARFRGNSRILPDGAALFAALAMDF